MKISRKARASAKRLFQACRSGARLDEARVREVVRRLGTDKPRDYLSILQQLGRLVALEEARTTAVVESPTALGAAEPEVTAALRRQFGDGIRIRSEVNPALLGGLRLRVGSDVWDGSVRGRLDALAKTF